MKVSCKARERLGSLRAIGLLFLGIPLLKPKHAVAAWGALKLRHELCRRKDFHKQIVCSRGLQSFGILYSHGPLNV